MNQEGRHLEVHRFSFDQREREGQQQILGAPLGLILYVKGRRT